MNVTMSRVWDRVHAVSVRMRAMLRASIFVATVFIAGCPSTRPEAPHIADDAPLRIRIAQAEVKRAGGVAELVELSRSGDVHQRELALRGLGRVGGTEALAALEAALDDPTSSIVTAAAYAIGVAGSLDDLDAATQARLTPKLVGLVPNAGAIEAIGRTGDATGQGALAQCAATNAACDLALGRHGRRKIALTPEARTALVAATSSKDVAVRYAATYALSREHEPPADEATNAALAARIEDLDGEIRATAIAGLAKRKAIATSRATIENDLRDPDWRVEIEAVRALAGPNGDDAGRALVAKSLETNANEQVVQEGLRMILANPGAPVDAFVDKPGWPGCLARAASPGVATAATVDAVAKCSLPDHLKLPLLAERFDAARSDAGYRRAALRILLAHDDPRVRAAGIGVLKDTWNDGDERS
ncbi:MAG: hypothetical protein HOV81_35960, partial [Kofleriaceae bacterium]|nr:hypothetical protein [Kofleriaceae bacterium]